MDYMQAIGNLKTEIKRADKIEDPLLSFMETAGNMFMRVMLDHIQEQGANSNGVMSQGLKVIPRRDNEGVAAPFTAESEYTQWRNDGVSGTQVQRDTPFSFKSQHPSKAMAQSMEQWLVNANQKAKNTISYFNGQGVTDYGQMSWAVAYGVLRKGIEGAKFIERAFNDENLNSFENAILTLTEQYTTGKFEKIIPNLK
jgi:hypothetical protein